MFDTLEPLSRSAWAQWMEPPLWGMLHLLPLPGSPRYGGDAEAPLRRALEDADRLVEAGFGGLVVENYGDLPFFAENVPPITVALLGRVAGAVRERHPGVRIAVNCLRNDAIAALSAAVAAGADAIRVNVHVGAALTDQGVLTGRAAETLRLRRELGRPVRILADLRVKHAAPLAERPLGVEASDLRQRGFADALLLTGSGTGRPADPGSIAAIRAGAPDAPLVVASGVTEESAAEWAALVDGAIVGSSVMREGVAGAGVDPDRARRLVGAWHRGRAVREGTERSEES